MSKKDTQAERDNFQQEWKENTQKVKEAGIVINKTSGMGNNYFSYKGVAYDSHSEAVKDVVKRENLK
jgi:hypothetical protein